MSADAAAALRAQGVPEKEIARVLARQAELARLREAGAPHLDVPFADRPGRKGDDS